jgi:hypothetical protein
MPAAISKIRLPGRATGAIRQGLSPQPLSTAIAQAAQIPIRAGGFFIRSSN